MSTIPETASSCRRRPSIAAAAADLRKAGLTLHSARITVEGEYVFVFSTATTMAANPWDDA